MAESEYILDHSLPLVDGVINEIWNTRTVGVDKKFANKTESLFVNRMSTGADENLEILTPYYYVRQIIFLDDRY